MASTRWKYFFTLVTIGYFLGMLLQQDVLQFICKPLLIASLTGYFIAGTKNAGASVKKWVVAALIFSVAGDSLLLFANSRELFFILGLLAFLIAHIFYIVCFHQIKTKETLPGKWYTAVIVGAYFLLMMSFLVPHLGVLKIPVLVYGMMISFMLFVATQLYALPDEKAGRYILTGAVLFVISDSVLAINKFYHPVPWGGWAIMVTYVLAQWLIVKGMMRYLADKHT